MDAAFYLPDGPGRYVATEHARGPWDPRAQHGGPPAALLAHVLDEAHPNAELQLARITVELLGPVPIAPLTATTAQRRAGRRVELLEATLAADGEAVALARAWRIRPAARDLPPPPAPTLPAPETGREARFFPGLPDVGWHTAVEARFLAGAWEAVGPGSAWFRMRIPLVAGREPAPVERMLVAADAGNGISAAVDFTRHLFVNPDLTVSLHRLPEGEWVHLAAETTVGPEGVGLATTRLSDRRGPVGVGAQSLYVAPRDA